jgi:hypothetical protein
MKPRRLAWGIAILGASLVPSPALADNCSDLSDCFNGNINPAIWVILGLLAILLISLLIGSLGGGGVLLAGLRAVISRAGSVIARTVGRLLARFIARRGIVTVEQAIGRGLVREGGKLAQVLRGVQTGFRALPPKSLADALKVVGNAVESAGLSPGVATSV